MKVSHLVLAFVVLLLVTFASAQATYAIDPPHSTAIFKIKHADVGYTYGRFNEIDPSLSALQYDAANPTASNLSLVIIVDSVDTNNARRDGHLKSGDFFDSAQNPTIEFYTTSVEATDDDAVYNVTGDVIIRNVSKTITVPVTFTGEGTNQKGKHFIGLHTEFDLSLSDFSFSPDWIAPTGPVSDELSVIVSLEAIEQ